MKRTLANKKNMELYHATKENRRESASTVAENIASDGFIGSNDIFLGKNLVFLSEKPIAGFGGWCDAWVVVDIPDEIAEKYHYDSDDDNYHCRCFAIPTKIVNQYEMYATTENESDEQ